MLGKEVALDLPHATTCRQKKHRAIVKDGEVANVAATARAAVGWEKYLELASVEARQSRKCGQPQIAGAVLLDPCNDIVR
jgi:hypothetical protein